MEITHFLCCIMLLCVACQAVPYFPTLTYNCHNFQKKLLDIKGVFWYSLQHLSPTFLFLRRIQWDFIINLHRSSCKVPAFVCQILIKPEFSWQNLKNSSNIKFHESPSSGSRVVLWRMDGWTGLMKLSLFTILPTHLKTRMLNKVQWNNSVKCCFFLVQNSPATFYCSLWS